MRGGQFDPLPPLPSPAAFLGLNMCYSLKLFLKYPKSHQKKTTKTKIPG